MILFAKYLYMLIIVLAVVFLLLQKRPVQKQMLIFSIINLPITYLVAKIASHFYFDPRPFVVLHIKPLIDHAMSNGFPSDHTLISVAIAMVLFAFNKKWGITASVLAVIVGISRMYVRVHWPIDILGSFVIGIFVGLGVYFLLKKFVFPKISA